jgi:hypothetical protein
MRRQRRSIIDAMAPEDDRFLLPRCGLELEADSAPEEPVRRAPMLISAAWWVALVATLLALRFLDVVMK